MNVVFARKSTDYQGQAAACEHGKTINRAGFRRVTDDDQTEFYFLPEVFKTEICEGLNPKEVTKALREAGYLLLAPDGSNQRQERLPGIGSKKVYRIKTDILGERSLNLFPCYERGKQNVIGLMNITDADEKGCFPSKNAGETRATEIGVLKAVTL